MVPKLRRWILQKEHVSGLFVENVITVMLEIVLHTGCFKKSFTMVFQILLRGDCYNLSIVQGVERWMQTFS
jgi:hypothetical protein